MVDAIVDTVKDHRRRIADLLHRLDELRRDEAVPCATEREDGTQELAPLFVAIADRLRTGDSVLRDVVVQLRGRID